MFKRTFNTHHHGVRAWWLGLALATGWWASALAQTGAYPQRPIKVIVPYAVGGATDVLTRVVSDAVARSIGLLDRLLDRPFHRGGDLPRCDFHDSRVDGKGDTWAVANHHARLFEAAACDLGLLHIDRGLNLGDGRQRFRKTTDELGIGNAALELEVQRRGRRFSGHRKTQLAR